MAEKECAECFKMLDESKFPKKMERGKKRILAVCNPCRRKRERRNENERLKEGFDSLSAAWLSRRLV